MVSIRYQPARQGRNSTLQSTGRAATAVTPLTERRISRVSEEGLDRRRKAQMHNAEGTPITRNAKSYVSKSQLYCICKASYMERFILYRDIRKDSGSRGTTANVPTNPAVNENRISWRFRKYAILCCLCCVMPVSPNRRRSNLFLVNGRTVELPPAGC